jgi:hypothetical protein
VKVGDLVRVLRSDIHGAIGMIVRANVAPDVSLRGEVHTVEMYGSDWRWSAGSDGLSRIAFVEGDLELISG